MLTVSLLSRWARFGSDRDFYGYASRHWRAAFPDWPERSRFNRLLRAGVPWLIGFSHFLVSQLRARACTYEALDTMGCATRSVHRRGRGWRAGEANRGFCNRMGWYDGLNVMTSVTPEGVITGFGCAPASTKEQPYAETFLAARATQPAGLAEVGIPARGGYVTDNGFCGDERHQHWAQAYGARVINHPQRPAPLTRGRKLGDVGWRASVKSWKPCMPSCSSLSAWSANARTPCKVFGRGWPPVSPFA